MREYSLMNNIFVSAMLTNFIRTGWPLQVGRKFLPFCNLKHILKLRCQSICKTTQNFSGCLNNPLFSPTQKNFKDYLQVNAMLPTNF